MVGKIVDFALVLIGHLGFVGAGLIVAVENILPFIPSEAILPAIGMAINQHKFGIDGYFGLVLMVIITTLSAVIGALILFIVSRHIGVERVAKLPFIKRENIQKAEDSFAKHGNAAVFFCRFLPVVRVLVTIPAGLSSMSKRRFLIYSTAATLIWNSIFVSIGFFVGSKWDEIEPIFSRYSYLTLAVIILIFVGIWLFKKYRKSLEKITEDDFEDGDKK
ncbi:MAG: DedA family protein [Candidatus Ancillula sp.]|jgi:membrane protein DedA with SNARE-associated domain|nr:DedA family protein [Candidatus Ancillula sp.]